jgi:hypothetical protein
VYGAASVCSINQRLFQKNLPFVAQPTDLAFQSEGLSVWPWVKDACLIVPGDGDTTSERSWRLASADDRDRDPFLGGKTVEIPGAWVSWDGKGLGRMGHRSSQFFPSPPFSDMRWVSQGVKLCMVVLTNQKHEDNGLDGATTALCGVCASNVVQYR